MTVRPSSASSKGTFCDVSLLVMLAASDDSRLVKSGVIVGFDAHCENITPPATNVTTAISTTTRWPMEKPLRTLVARFFNALVSRAIYLYLHVHDLGERFNGLVSHGDRQLGCDLRLRRGDHVVVHVGQFTRCNLHCEVVRVGLRLLEIFEGASELVVETAGAFGLGTGTFDLWKLDRLNRRR